MGAGNEHGSKLDLARRLRVLVTSFGISDNYQGNVSKRKEKPFRSEDSKDLRIALVFLVAFQGTAYT